MERLAQALGMPTRAELAEALGLQRNAYYNRKASESLPFNEIVELCVTRGISVDWLVTGQGSPTKDPDLALVPVAQVAPELLAEIMGILEDCLSEVESGFEGQLDNRERAAARGFMAAKIFNKVASVKSAKLRTRLIRDEAENFALGARLTLAAAKKS